MLFCEPLFLFLFLPALLLCYYAAPQRLRNPILTAASLLFYSLGEWRFLGWLVASIALNYWIAVAIDRHRATPWAARLLALGVVSDLGLLVVFKYAAFFIATLNLGLVACQLPPLPLPSLALPLGISFFTFHKISYKLDVYRGSASACKSPLDLSLYILFFPQLIAGPIVRYHEVAAALQQRITSRDSFASGVRRFIIGLGKKMLLANSAALGADQLFAIPVSELTAPLAWLGVVSYALQIYFDFSGYSDMAIGLAAMFGFPFPENFDHPYVATSITEFWRRWHMSLSRWFRDYLYIPLGGNRAGSARTYLNLVLVFFLCGLWHGASFTFVVWGCYHGLLLVLERLGLGTLLLRLPRPLRHLYALFCILCGWVFFRASDLSQARGFLAAMFGGGHGSGLYRLGSYLRPELVVAILVGALASLPLRARLTKWSESLQLSRSTGTSAVMALALDAGELLSLGGLFFLALLLIAARTYNPFIYFRF